MARDAQPPMLALGGGAGSGKSSIARALAATLPGTGLVHLDDCYHTDPALAPSVPRVDGAGFVVDFSNPDSIDPERVDATLRRQARSRLVVVEGIFALTLPALRQ